MLKIILGIFLPFLGTIIGSAMVFFMKREINNKIYKLLMGYAAGVMVAASIWSLLIPALEQGEELFFIGWLPAVAGLVVGFSFLLILDYLNKRINKNIIQKKSLLIFSITLHNIPEGMAVGVALAGAYFGNVMLTMTSALIISVGIAIQNIPEGAIVSMPSKIKGQSKMKSFFKGVLSGVVEPIFAILTFFITGFISSVLPFILAFAAGSMIFVVVNEIIPENTLDKNTILSTIGFALGFISMLILDVSLG